MKEAFRQTRSELMRLFRQHGFGPRTDLGQNFLIDLNLVEYLVRQGEITDADVVLEVGAGTGGLTTFLAQSAAAVISVEVDPRVYSLAIKEVESFENVTLLNCDALKTKNRLAPSVLDALQQKLDEQPGRRLKLISNLPYNIATPVVSNLVATDLPLERAVVTIQLELGLRMMAKPGHAEYGALSVWLQSQCSVRILKKLPPTVFWPRPQVHSAIVRLFPRPHRRNAIQDRPFLHDFLRRLFHQRRKRLRRVLVGMYRKQLQKQEVDAVLQTMGLNDDARAEGLDVATLVELANRFYETVPQEGRTAEPGE